MPHLPRCQAPLLVKCPQVYLHHLRLHYRRYWILLKFHLQCPVLRQARSLRHCQHQRRLICQPQEHQRLTHHPCLLPVQQSYPQQKYPVKVHLYCHHPLLAKTLHRSQHLVQPNSLPLFHLLLVLPLCQVHRPAEFPVPYQHQHLQ